MAGKRKSQQDPSPRRRRLSLARVVVALGVFAGIGAGGAVLVRDTVERITAGSADTWFAPYVDTTLTPSFHFEDPAESPALDVVLGFVVAGADGSCAPTWGTHFTLDEAAARLDLDRRIARLRQRDGDVIVSFGGAINNELALRCATVEDLVGAYRAVIDRYGLTTVDFDLEGGGLVDPGATARRAQAAATLQESARAEGRSLAVWLTLPVAPDGLSDAGVAAVDAMLAAGVDLAGVNVMTMDYGSSRPAEVSMWDATERALLSTWQQLSGSYVRAGSPQSTDDVWRKLGATPMLGQNDAPDDRFGLDDGERLVRFARDHRMGRVSMWSANRDGPCGAQLDTHTVSNTCSGTPQEPGEFARVFGQLPGRASAAASRVTVADAAPPTPDDPATSPYPIWRSSRVYEQGAKVVWHHGVYEAKWWTQGDMPDEPVKNVWDTPWRYVGPVLPSDRPTTASTLAPSAYPVWDAATVYDTGDRVRLGDLAYEAKWWTRGDRPDRDVDRPWDTPWEPLDG